MNAERVEKDETADSRPSGRELLLIVVFWTLFAVLTAANRLLDPRGGFRASASANFAALAFFEAYLWALLTPLIFWMASRFTIWRGARAGRVLLFLLAGIAIALAHDALVDWMRAWILPPPPRGAFGGRGGGGGGGFRRYWALNDLVIYMGVLAAGVARDFSLRFRHRQEETARLQSEAARLEAQLAEARLAALRNQLDPHFLFNTLHAIASLVERDPRGVRRMISRLSELLRFSIEGAASAEQRLDRELELLERYLDIMQVRFQGRLEIERTIDPATREALVPTLILQPIVENAIKHGAEKLEGVAHVRIEIIIENGQLVMRVTDNGPGLTLSGLGSRPDGSGVGISNTVARLAHLYGTAASFTLSAADGSGAVAEIRLPLHT